jgi:peroxiredoxin
MPRVPSFARRSTVLSLVALATLSLVPIPSLSGEFNKTLSVGDAAPAISGLVGTDDKPHGLADFDDKQVVVVVFTCNTCPYATDLDVRLVELAKSHAEDRKVGFLAINPNKVAGDKLPDMKKRSEASGFSFAYAWDETQLVAKAYGASYTPECFVLSPMVEGKRKVVYQGSFDDSPDGKNVQNRYVEQAVLAALTGKNPAKTETPSIGCAVRYEKSKRKK